MSVFAGRGSAALILRAAFVASVLFVSPWVSSSASARDFNAEEKKNIEKIVREYLIAHPEVLVEAMQELQAKQDAAEQKGQASALVKHRDILEQDPASFVAGNPKGDVTVVEFFDYQCGYCKRSLAPLLDVVKQDGKVRLVLKEFPILSAESVLAAKAAIASLPQGKYLAFHQALYQHKGALSEDKIMAIAKSVGLDEKRLALDMKNSAVGDTIDRNHNLGQELAIRGTPAFVIGGKVYPGAMSSEELKAAIKEARSKKG